MSYRWMISERLLLSILLVVLTSISLPAEEKSRVWTSSDGRTLTGVLKEKGDGWVKIEIKRKIHQIKLEKLSKKDREYIKNLVIYKPLEVKVRLESYKDSGLDKNIKTVILELTNVPKETEYYCLLVWISALKTSGTIGIKSVVESFLNSDCVEKYEAGFYNNRKVGEAYRGYALRLYDPEGKIVAERVSSNAYTKYLDQAPARFKPEPKVPKEEKKK